MFRHTVSMLGLGCAVSVTGASVTVASPTIVQFVDANLAVSTHVEQRIDDSGFVDVRDDSDAIDSLDFAQNRGVNAVINIGQEAGLPRTTSGFASVASDLAFRQIGVGGSLSTQGANDISTAEANVDAVFTFDLLVAQRFTSRVGAFNVVGDLSKLTPGHFTLKTEDGQAILDQTLTYSDTPSEFPGPNSIVESDGILEPGRYVFAIELEQGSTLLLGQDYTARMQFVPVVPLPAAFWPGLVVLGGLVGYQVRRRARATA
jgi:hypothetical protein